jgi:hypothetical protein
MAGRRIGRFTMAKCYLMMICLAEPVTDAAMIDTSFMQTSLPLGQVHTIEKNSSRTPKIPPQWVISQLLR